MPRGRVEVDGQTFHHLKKSLGQPGGHRTPCETPLLRPWGAPRRGALSCKSHQGS